jgi:hypothetical protein
MSHLDFPCPCGAPGDVIFVCRSHWMTLEMCTNPVDYVMMSPSGGTIGIELNVPLGYCNGCIDKDAAEEWERISWEEAIILSVMSK